MSDEHIRAYNQEKQDMINLIESMSYERALRYIARKLNDLKAIRKTKSNKTFIAESVRQLKQKQKEINKKIKQQENIKIDNLFDENKQLKQELKAVRKANKEAVDKIKRLKTAQLVQYKNQ